MKFIKGTILIILVLTAVGVLFRGWIYRSLVTYKTGFGRGIAIPPARKQDLMHETIFESGMRKDLCSSIIQADTIK